MSELLDATDAEEQTAEIRRNGAAVPRIRPTDGERLMRFWRYRDEAAFAEVVEIHAPMVWGVCSQVLRHRQDVEDAFQATFLILARKAKSIRACESAAGWLYRVAFRTALLARNRRNGRAAEPLFDEPASDEDQLESIARHEQCRVLLEELHALPLQYRQPLVLCYLEGRSRSEAADELGVTPQSVKGRLARGTRLLRTRMVSRGVALSATMAVVSAEASSVQASAAGLVASTASMGALFAAKPQAFGQLFFVSAKGAVAAPVALAEKGILAMKIAAAAKPATALFAACVTAGMLTIAAADTPESGGTAGARSAFQLVAAGEAAEESSDDVDVEVKAEPSVLDEESPLTRSAPSIDELSVSPSPPAAAGATEPVDVETDPFATREAAPAAASPQPMTLPPQLHARMTALQPATASGSSREAMGLEQEYWLLKAKGLGTKVKALELKAAAGRNEGVLTEVEKLETAAEIDLTKAEVKMCEANAVRLKDSLQQLNQQAATPQPVQPTPAPASPSPAGINYYGTPQAPVPAALPWTPQPDVAIPAAPAQMPEPVAQPRYAPATTKPRTKAVPMPSGWAVQATATAPSSRFVVTSESPEEMMRKFDAKRAANPQMSDAEFLRAFVNEKLRELQASNALGLAESQPAYMAPQPMLARPAPRPMPAAAISAEELAKLKNENAALKKQLKASEKAAAGAK